MSTPSTLHEYTCRKCRHVTLVAQRANGLVPAFIPCQSGSSPPCPSMMVSPYSPVQPTGTPTHELVKLSEDEIEQQPAHLRGAYHGGHLFLRKIDRPL